MRDTIYFGDSAVRNRNRKVSGSFITLDDQEWYRIENYDEMPPFFISITNPEDFWMFISSTGGLSCGRQNADNALFPYGTVDKVSASFSDSGSYTACLVDKDGKTFLWEPFNTDNRRVYDIRLNLYKTSLGDRILFEEINHTLELSYRVTWETSPRFGIHRGCSLSNQGDGSVSLSLVDGIRNILPAGTTDQVQSAFSNLLDAYKRSELDKQTGLGLFSLSATLTDQAEPSESLRATTVWSYGLERSRILLSENQLDSFLQGTPVYDEEDVKGVRGAFLISAEITLPSGQSDSWGLCAELRQDHSRITALREELRRDRRELADALRLDIDESSRNLRDIIARNDGIQSVGSKESAVHHASNVLFNIMRGGYFIDGYTIDSSQFIDFVKLWNKECARANGEWLDQLPHTISINELQKGALSLDDSEMERLTLEYLPLTFSRRHGDPSRPWNKFNIQTRDKEGRQILGYQGNWRDIFQNWEALCFSYPLYLPSVISKFINATTMDGYNPYRISQEGIDWEVPEPGNPWANIGYWSDHQIIYLSKLLEHCRNFMPETLHSLAERRIFTYAEVPYRIKGFDELRNDPYDSIDFDGDLNSRLLERRRLTGADGFLKTDEKGHIIHSTLGEKMLVLFLAKLSNYVAGGGIWMNTQRPEWNDANNALAGWGLSMVTLSYLTRFTGILELLLLQNEELSLHTEVASWLIRSLEALEQVGIEAVEDDKKRYDLLSGLGQSASDYRAKIYNRGFTGEETVIPRRTLEQFFNACTAQFKATIQYSRNEDGSFESYQILSLERGRARIKKLYLMLEGQVAGLSLDYFPCEQTCSVLDIIRQSPLYRQDQHSYMLYPNRDISGFLWKNNLRDEDLHSSGVLKPEQDEYKEILSRDTEGLWHFCADFRNGKDLKKAASHLSREEQQALADLFEQVFHHSQFTGRSGTFFGYEGLGSIYWHMVSKLLLAVQERLIDAVQKGADTEMIQELKDKYKEIRSGIGFNKEPEVYGAFPCDPYSHTPWGKGAKQPGMTGQVKEEILTRFAELGLVVKDGALSFIPEMILEDQWRPESDDFQFDYCSVPFTVTRGDSRRIELETASGDVEEIDGLCLSREVSYDIFSRNRRIRCVKVWL